MAPHLLKRWTGEEYQIRALPTNLFWVLWISILCNVGLLTDGVLRLLCAISREKERGKFDKKGNPQTMPIMGLFHQHGIRHINLLVWDRGTIFRGWGNDATTLRLRWKCEYISCRAHTVVWLICSLCVSILYRNWAFYWWQMIVIVSFCPSLWALKLLAHYGTWFAMVKSCTKHRTLQVCSR